MWDSGLHPQRLLSEAHSPRCVSSHMHVTCHCWRTVHAPQMWASAGEQARTPSRFSRVLHFGHGNMFRLVTGITDVLSVGEWFYKIPWCRETEWTTATLGNKGGSQKIGAEWVPRVCLMACYCFYWVQKWMSQRMYMVATCVIKNLQGHRNLTIKFSVR